MASISYDLQIHPENTNPSTPPPAACLTKAKIQRIALAILELAVIVGAAALITGMVAFSVSPFAGFGLIPLVAAGALIGWQLYTIKDYEDPKELKMYQERCANTSLDTSIKEHGIENVFKHQLITQEKFSDEYRKLLQQHDCEHTPSLRAISHLEKKFKKVAEENSYSLPSNETQMNSIRFLYDGLVSNGATLHAIHQKEYKGLPITNTNLKEFLSLCPLSANSFMWAMHYWLENPVSFEGLKVVLNLCSCIQEDSYQDVNGETYRNPKIDLLTAAFKKGALGIGLVKTIEAFDLNRLQQLGIFSGDQGCAFAIHLTELKAKHASLKREIKDIQKRISSLETERLLNSSLVTVNSDAPYARQRSLERAVNSTCLEIEINSLDKKKSNKQLELKRLLASYSDSDAYRNYFSSSYVTYQVSAPPPTNPNLYQ